MLCYAMLRYATLCYAIGHPHREDAEEDAGADGAAEGADGPEADGAEEAGGPAAGALRRVTETIMMGLT